MFYGNDQFYLFLRLHAHLYDRRATRPSRVERIVLLVSNIQKDALYLCFKAGHAAAGRRPACWCAMAGAQQVGVSIAAPLSPRRAGCSGLLTRKRQPVQVSNF